MKNVLVIGSTGQIGSELTRELRKRYGNDSIIAGYIKGAEPKGELKESGPSAEADVTNPEMIANIVKKYNVDTIYNLAALLSVVAEKKPQLAWKIGIDGLWNILEVARENNCAMDMMYMPDGLHAAISLMEADPTRLVHRNGFNIASMSFDPEEIFQAIKRHKPNFEMEYDVDMLKQGIADSWPDSLDDSCARAEWDWKPQYDLESMTVDMLKNLEAKLK